VGEQAGKEWPLLKTLSKKITWLWQRSQQNTARRGTFAFVCELRSFKTAAIGRTLMGSIRKPCPLIDLAWHAYLLNWHWTVPQRKSTSLTGGFIGTLVSQRLKTKGLFKAYIKGIIL
jgi:hypothetical protein